MCLTHERHGRRLSTAVVVLAIWTGLIALWIAFAASSWLLVPIALTTLPALWDLIANPTATFRMDDKTASWKVGRYEGDVPLTRIARARFDTLWDFSVRVTFETADRRTIRLPPDCTPPHRTLESALHDRGVTTIRFHFTPNRSN